MSKTAARVENGQAKKNMNWMLACGGIIMAAVFLIAIIAPFIWGDMAVTLSGDTNKGSMPGHILGTDSLGRDMLARTLVATRLTVFTSLAATAIAAVLGILIGIGVWLSPKAIRELGLRCIEFLVTYPTLLVAIMVASILGKGMTTVVFAIGIANIAGFARLTANLAAGLAHQDYVITAKLIGVPPLRLAVRHILPNMAEPMLIIVAQSFSGALVEISALSFVGLGSQNPQFDFGTLLSDALNKLMVNPTLVIGPAGALFLTSFASLLIGDGLAAIANPQSTNSKAEIMKEPDHSEDEFDSDRPLLEVSGINVEVNDNGKKLVQDISFDIHEGEILGIVGESGSGKSLTASVISKLLPEGLTAKAKKIRLGETDLLSDVPADVLAKEIGLVYQDAGAALNPALTLGSQFSDVLIQHIGMSKKEAERTLTNAFSKVWLTNPEKRLAQRPFELSGGMKQRSMIASAMSLNPRLLIADEPTTALDVTVQREILSIIRKMNRESHTAVLFISHDIGVVKRLCDRVIVMKQGRIVDRVDDMSTLTVEKASHPYTRQLLESTPKVRLSSTENADDKGMEKL